MLNTLLIAAFLLAGQEAPETGIIAGTLVDPAQQQITQPVQVILLSPRYFDLWNSEVQKRLDVYWQQFQLTFANRKELFTEFSKRAHQDATAYVVSRMQRDRFEKMSEYFIESADGKFEFRNIPFGEYKVLALGKIGNQFVMWQDSIDVRSAIPHFLELKKRVP